MFIFLMCSERSGSNFITKLMNGHPNIVGPSPKHIINPLARNAFRYGELTDDDNWNELLNDIYNLINVSFSEWKSEISLEKLSEMGKEKNIAKLIRNIFFEEAKLNNAEYVFVKENQIYEFILFLVQNYPEAKYVYQVRDPRDMALSWKKNPSHKGGIVKAAKQWKKDQMNYLKNYWVLKESKQIYLIKYEDLISNSEKYLNEICEFLDIEYSSKILEFYKDELTIKNSMKQGAWNNLSKEIITDNSKKYKKELSEEEIKIIEKICFSEMKYLNYETEYDLEELKDISEASISEKEAEEEKDIRYVPKEGVVLNMEAKRRFYQKVIK